MIDSRLKNFLKLPKASNWLYYEWFYSDMDKVVFDMKSEFITCLKTSFPDLDTSRISRSQWCKIRKLLGKPRRCSQSFFNEERNALKIKREKIRSLWHIDYDKTTDYKTTMFINSLIKNKNSLNQMGNTATTIEDYFLQDLPPYIPHPLIVGSKVMARIRQPCDGMFRGRITAIDHSKWEYRVAFDQPFLGTQSIPDFEIMSWREGENGTISVTAILKMNNLVTGQNQNHQQSQYVRMYPLQATSQIKSSQDSPFSPKSFLSPLASPKGGVGASLTATSLLNRTPIRFYPKSLINNANDASYGPIEDKGLVVGFSPLKPDKMESNHMSPSKTSLQFEDDNKVKLLTSPNDWRSILLRNIHVENNRLASQEQPKDGRPTLVCGRLETLVRVAACYKLLMYKAKHLDALRKMNREAEKMHYTSSHLVVGDGNAFTYPQPFKIKYAELVLEIIHLDRSLFELCNKVVGRVGFNKPGLIHTGPVIPDLSDVALSYLRYPKNNVRAATPNSNPSQGHNNTWFEAKQGFYFDEAARIVDTVLNHSQGTYAALGDLAKAYHARPKESLLQRSKGSMETDVKSGIEIERGGDVALTEEEYRGESATRILNLITHYTSTLLQLKLSPPRAQQQASDARDVADSSSSSELYRLESLAQSINHIKKDVLEPENIASFRDQVEVHMNHLKNMIVNARRPILNSDST